MSVFKSHATLTVALKAWRCYCLCLTYAFSSGLVTCQGYQQVGWSYLLALQLLLTDELQLGQEALSQVAVLQHHPEALLDALINPALCHRALPLPQGHHLHPPPPLLSKLQQGCCRVTAPQSPQSALKQLQDVDSCWQHAHAIL